MLCIIICYVLFIWPYWNIEIQENPRQETVRKQDTQLIWIRTTYKDEKHTDSDNEFGTFVDTGQ